MADPSTYIEELAREVQRRSISICFVCAGNICRSPMAESVARSAFTSAGIANVVVSSAGTGSWHVGQNADPRARAALAKAGFELEGHRAKKFQDAWSKEVDLVVALDRSNYRDLARLGGIKADPDKLVLLRSFQTASSPLSGRHDLDVPDPYLGTHRDFELALNIIRDSLSGLLGYFAP